MNNRLTHDNVLKVMQRLQRALGKTYYTPQVTQGIRVCKIVGVSEDGTKLGQTVATLCWGESVDLFLKRVQHQERARS